MAFIAAPPLAGRFQPIALGLCRTPLPKAALMPAAAANSMIRLVLGVVGLACLAVAALAALTINDVPKSIQRTQTAWREVETSYRQRAGLVPSIIGAVRAVTSTQAGLIARIEARQAAVLALKPDPAAPAEPAHFHDFMKVQDELSVPLGLVLDLMRLYPDQSREAAMRKVFDDLELSESHIVVMRTDYIANARLHNSNIADMPGVVVAKLFHPEARPVVADFSAAEP